MDPRRESSGESFARATDSALHANVSSADAAGAHRTQSEEAPPVGPEFTLRAVLTGMALATVLAICNLYVGLKMGVVINMSIVAALLGYAGWSGARAASGRRLRTFGILENNINQTTCSSGSLVASAGLIAPIPALAVMTGANLTWHVLALWVFAVCLLGILVAVALRQQMLLKDNLPFPLGTASAEMLRELHGRGKEAAARVKALLVGGVASAGVSVAALVWHWGPWTLPTTIRGFSLKSLTFTFSPNPLYVAIGGLIGFRPSASLLLGSVLAYAVIAPPLMRSGDIWLTVREPLPELPVGVEIGPRDSGDLRFDARRGVLIWKGIMSPGERERLLAQSGAPQWQQAVRNAYERSQVATAGSLATAGIQRAQPSFGDMLQWLVWPGMTLMVVSSLVSFAFSWRSVAGLVSSARGRPADEAVRRALPGNVFIACLLGVLAMSVVLQVSLFAIVWWAALCGVLLAFVLAIVAVRVNGETGITPVGPMGKVAQLTLGGLAPSSAAANLMAANVAGGAASQAADLLNDLKCGLTVGASPRWQALAQFCGVTVGALTGALFYLLLIPDPQAQLFTAEWPAPAAITLKAVAELFQSGFQALPPNTPTAMLVAALAGVVLPLGEKLLPAQVGRFIPSAASVGLGFVLPASQALLVFLGGTAALVLKQGAPRWSERFLVAGCTGAVTGAALFAVGYVIAHVT